MGSVVFSDSYYVSYVGDISANVRLTINESYAASTNKTTLTLSKIELQIVGNTINFGSCPLLGSIKIAGTTVATIDNSAGGKIATVALSGSGYCQADLSNLTISTVTVEHNTDGTKEVSVQLLPGYTQGESFFCARYQGGVTQCPYGVRSTTSNPVSKTLTLTDRGHTLTTAVSPSGYGTVTDGAKLANGKTKSLTATPASTTAQYSYAFSKWTVSGTGASLSSTTAATTTFTMGSANATVTATFTRTTRSYTVTCEDRIGSSSGTKLGSKTASYSYGSSVSGASFGSDTTYDKYYTGYHYTGSSSAITVDGTETVYRYFALNTWTVSYNANGHGTAPASQTKTYGTNLTLRSFISDQTGTGTKATYTITGNANGSSWSGSNGSASKTPNYTYSQTYWNTKSDGTGTNYSSGGTYSSNAAATMYARWSTSTTYSYTYTLPTGTPTKSQSRSVTFNANGGTGAPAAQSSSRAMTFNGWYTAASGGTKRTTSSQVSASETVYAQFGNGTANYPSITLSTTKPTKASTSAGSYTVTYNYNGNGQSNTTATAARTTAYTFSKWNTAANGSGTNYNSGGTYSSNSAATLYAQYTSSTSTAAVTLPTPTRSGYTFDGWYTQASGGTKIGNAGASYTPSTDATVYAHWTLKSYKLTISQGTGTTITVKRGNDTLANNATIYHFDELSIKIAVNTGYTIGTHKVNSTNWTTGSFQSHTVSGAVTVTATATPTEYTLSLTVPSTGVTVNVYRDSSSIGGASSGYLSNGAKIYYNDALTVSYAVTPGYELTTATVGGVSVIDQPQYNATVTGNLAIVFAVKVSAVAYIGSGTEFERYQIFIGNGTSWDQYQAYIGDGTNWVQY